MFRAAMAGMIALAAVAALPPAERLIFVGTYTGPESKGIHAFRFNEDTGALSPAGLAAETPSPSFIIANRTGKLVFAVNETSTFNPEKMGSVTSFAVDASTAKLTAINTQASAGSDPCHLALDGSERFLAVANYTSGTFSLFAVAPNGRLGPASTVVTTPGSGPNRARQTGPHAHEVVFDPANRFLIAADLGIDRLLVYKFDARTGTLTRNTPPSAVLPPGSGPRHVALHPGGRWLFSINELSSTIATFAWNADSGTLAPVGSPVPTVPAGFQGMNSTAEIAIHPSGKFLYGSNRGHDSIVVFRVNPSNAALTLVEHEPTRGQTPRNFAIDPTGRWLIAANQKSNTLAVFRIDQSTGVLTPVGPLASVGAPVSILFM